MRRDIAGIALIAILLSLVGVTAVSETPVSAIALPEIGIGDVAVWEGDAGKLTVRVPVDLSNTSATTTSVRYAVSAGTATTGTEFTAKSGTVTFPAGATTKPVLVTVFADTVEESDETVNVTLSAPLNATLGDTQGEVTIRDDDTPGTGIGIEVAIGDVTVTESDGGKHVVSVPVTLSEPAPTTVKIAATTTCSTTADDGVDYLTTRNRLVTFLTGVRSKVLNFTIVGDVSSESINAIVQNITVALGPVTIRDDVGEVTIIDDDPGAPPQVGEMLRVSVASDGSEAETPDNVNCAWATAGSDAVEVSADGRYVLFWSLAANLVPDDTNGELDLFIHDLFDRSTERVSVGTGGIQASISNGSGAISADGRFVLFPSSAPSLLPTGTTTTQMFRHDRLTNTTEIVSLDSADQPVNDYSYLGSISHDGQLVLFVANVGGPDTLWLRDLTAGTTEFVANVQDGFYLPDMSADGRFVMFVSPDTDLVAGDTNAFPDLFVKDRQFDTIDRINVSSDESQEINFYDHPVNVSLASITDDGRYVLFGSRFSSISEDPHQFLRDRLAGTTTQVDVGLPSAPSGERCITGYGEIATAGRYVVLQRVCGTDNAMFTNRSRSVWVRDLALGTATRIDVADDGTPSNADPSYGFNQHISGDGSVVAFGSYADNLVAEDTNDARDVFATRRF